MAAGVAGTVGGLYFVLTQDLGHGPGHDEDHHAEAHETHGKNGGQDDEGDKDKSQGGPKDELKSKSKNAPAEEGDTEEPKGTVPSGDKPKNDESGHPSPDRSDKVSMWHEV